MARPTLETGDIWSEVLANASIRPTIDGADNPGSIDFVRDEHLDSSSDQIKARFYGFWNRVKVEIGVGLSCTFSGAPILRRNGSLVALNAGSVTLPPNSSVFLFVDDIPQVSFSASLPIECIPLAFATTNASGVVTLLDLRDKVVEQIRPRYLPETASPFQVGDVKPSFSANLESGWLWCHGQLVSTSVYPALFGALGYRFGGSGSLFKIPDLRGRSLKGAGQGDNLANYTLGAIGGAENRQLTIAQMPSHNHAILDNGHIHTISDPGHAHATIDPGHAHAVYDPGHAHTIDPFRAAALNDRPNDGAGAEVSLQGTGRIIPTTAVQTGVQVAAALTNLGIRAASANISLSPATSNVSVTANGGGAAFSTLDPYCAVNWLIKI